MRNRVRVEVEWLIFLSRDLKLPEFPTLADADVAWLRALYENFGPAEFESIRDIERVTNHDVKSVEYFPEEPDAGHRHLSIPRIHSLRLHVRGHQQSRLRPDVEGGDQRCLAAQARGSVADLEGRAVALRDTSMLSHTHGQAATPTTLGKEFAVLAYRLKRQLSAARGLAFLGKFNGATARSAPTPWPIPR